MSPEDGRESVPETATKGQASVDLDPEILDRLEELAEATYRYLTPAQGVDGAHVEALESVVDALRKAAAAEAPSGGDVDAGRRPGSYETDAGVRLTWDTLTDRGYDPGLVASAIDAYEGDLWFDVFGPALDRTEELLGLDLEDDEADAKLIRKHNDDDPELLERYASRIAKQDADDGVAEP